MPCIVRFMPRPRGGHPHRVVALALTDVVLLDLAAPTHLFGHCGAPHYAFALAGVRPGPIRSSAGIEVMAPAGIEALEHADTIVVPGIGPDADPQGFAAAAHAVARAHRAGARVMSICTGAFVLAEAGVLDGRRATTHWDSTERLARRYPRVSVDPSVLYVDEGSVLTSAGVAAGLDLCLHVIRRDHGAAFAAHIARRTVVAPHRDGGQAQFVGPPDRGRRRRCGHLAGGDARVGNARGSTSPWTWPRWRAGRACRHAASPVASARRRAPRPRNGCWISARASPRACWRRPTSLWSTWLCAPALAQRRRCAPISAAGWRRRRRRTGGRFASAERAGYRAPGSAAVERRPADPASAAAVRVGEGQPTGLAPGAARMKRRHEL